MPRNKGKDGKLNNNRVQQPPGTYATQHNETTAPLLFQTLANLQTFSIKNSSNNSKLLRPVKNTYIIRMLPLVSSLCFDFNAFFGGMSCQCRWWFFAQPLFQLMLVDAIKWNKLQARCTHFQLINNNKVWLSCRLSNLKPNSKSKPKNKDPTFPIRLLLLTQRLNKSKHHRIGNS